MVAQSPQRLLRILLVDDSLVARVTYRRYLQEQPNQSYQFLEAETLTKGLELWKAEKPDLVLLDLRLPDGNGTEFLETIRAGLPDRPVIVLTGQGDEQSAVQCMKLGAADYLVKSGLTAALLRSCIEQVREHMLLTRQLTRSQQQKELLSEIALRIQQSLDLSQILQSAVVGLRQLLDCDRALIYQFYPDWSGRVTVESVSSEALSILNQEIFDSCFAANWHELYQRGKAGQGHDREDSALNSCNSELLAELQVQANLVTPIFQDEQLWGLLIAHECHRPRSWDVLDIHWVQQLATQVSIAIQQANAYAQLQQLNQELEERVQQRTAALEQSESHLRFQAAILQDIHDAVVSTDRHGIIESWNHGAEQIFGYTAAEMMGQSIGILYEHPEDLENILAVLLAKERHEVDIACRAKSGERLYVQLRLSLSRDEQGNIVRVLGVSNDISMAKQAELVREQFEAQLQQTNKELARATRLKDEFLANMSHELRTPLNAILGMSEGLQDEVFGSLNEQQLLAINTVEKSGRHLLELINDILDLAKISSGKVELQPAEVPVQALCASSLVFVKQQALQKKIQISSEIPVKLNEIWADERRMRQVLINLLTNAVKFTPGGGQVTLKVAFWDGDNWQGDVTVPEELAKHESPLIIFQVIDTGIGISQIDLPRLFQPFVQVDSSLNRQQAGTGLGLAMVKQIVELHQGQVIVDSQLGQGSCFTIALPYRISESHCSVVEPAAPVTVQPLSEHYSRVERCPVILLAEDNAANIATFTAYLKNCNYQLISAKTGVEAVALAKAHHPDLVLMDIQMPEMDGLEAIRLIRSDNQLMTVPIIALTALAMPGDQERCLQAGANHYLSKPVKLKQLTEVIESFCQSNMMKSDHS